MAITDIHTPELIIESPHTLALQYTGSHHQPRPLKRDEPVKAHRVSVGSDGGQ